MKIKGKMLFTQVAGDTVAVPAGEAADAFHGVIRLNKTAVDIWHGLEDGLSAEEIARRLVDTYDGVNMEKALQCTNDLIAKARAAGLIED